MHWLRSRFVVVAAATLAALSSTAGGVFVMTTQVAHAEDYPVAVQNFAFSPPSITVDVGDTVTWTNSDSAAHTVTADDGSSFNQPLAANGGTATITFNTAGTFTYHCTIHPNMHGTVVVEAEEGGTPTATATQTSTATATVTASPVASASPTAGSSPTVIAPATGSGSGSPVESWAPLLALAGGLLIAAGLGSGALAISARRDD